MGVPVAIRRISTDYLEINAESADFQAESELNSRLASLRGDPSAHQLSGGATRTASITLLLCSLIGLSASLALIMTEKQYLMNPDTALVCDVNPLIGCSDWFSVWQNQVFFGVSNSVVGFGAFSALALLSLVLLGGSALPRFLWRILAISSGFAAIWLVWFMYQSFFVKAALCPYCVCVWIAAIPTLYLFISRALQAEHFGSGKAKDAGRFLVRNQSVALTAIYLTVVVTGVFALWDIIMRLF
ncbi:vitamin K epoxide reductase family protein [Arcanobacterium hippocoleae]